jgi:hypothetical protein
VALLDQPGGASEVPVSVGVPVSAGVPASPSWPASLAGGAHAASGICCAIRHVISGTTEGTLATGPSAAVKQAVIADWLPASAAHVSAAATALSQHVSVPHGISEAMQ